MNRACGKDAICRVGQNNVVVCVCLPGYKLINNYDCEDVNECKTIIARCDSHSVCINTPGSFRCICLPNFQMNDKNVCVDIDECDGGISGCDDSIRAKCSNSVGSYKCTCRDGYEANGRICTERNECDLVCDNMSKYCKMSGAKSKTCVCNSRYKSVNNGVKLICQDINECKLNKICHVYATCIEQSPGFKCDCHNASSRDICGCGLHGSCDNILGSCVCKPGFVEDLSLNRNKCQAYSLCRNANACHKLADCVDLMGSYKCICPSGMVGNGIDWCVVDACLTGVAGCSRNAICTNTDGRAICKCSNGFKGDGYICTKAGDDCDDLLNDCGENAVCAHSPPGSGRNGTTCVCEEGFHGDGELCMDVDECTQASVKNCDVNAICRNFDGGYLCSCLPGFIGDGHQCHDVYECNTKTNSCPHNSTCVDQIGGFRCQCHKGYIEDKYDQSCIPDRHIEYDLVNNSSVAIICTGRGTSDKCACQSRYKLIDGKCTDIDECTKLATSACDEATQVCFNIPGSFLCECTCGYESNRNGYCTNINECEFQRTPCDVKADSADLEGSYSCTCRDGYVGNGRICSPICGLDTCPERHDCTVVEGLPHCTCHCCEPLCSKPGLVCASNGRKFHSYSEMNDKACRTHTDLTLSYLGPCQNCRYSEWGSWSLCSETCNQGVSLRNRKILAYSPDPARECYRPIQLVKDCVSKPCKGDVCDQYKECTNPYQYCVVDRPTGLPKCTCPTCLYEPYDPVCAQFGYILVSSESICALLSKACKAGIDYRILHSGKCKEGGQNTEKSPMNCMVMPLKAKYKDELLGCETINEIQLNLCSGGCGPTAGLCCEPSVYEYHEESMVCPNGETNVKAKILLTNECACTSELISKNIPKIKH